MERGCGKDEAITGGQTDWNFIFCCYCSYIAGIAEAAKKSPELIQLLELHTQFASITPYTQVSGAVQCERLGQESVFIS